MRVDSSERPRHAPMDMSLLLLFLVCLSVPALYAFAALALDLPISKNGFETDKYTNISVDWLRNGLLPSLGEPPPAFIPNTTRLPAYPAFIAILFAMFGIENFFPVLIAQTLIAGGAIFLVALSAREMNRSWTWPAAILGALTLNLAYRGTIALPDTFLAFLVAAFVYTALKTLSAPRSHGWLVAMSAVAGVAILTRPVFQFVAYFALPAFVAALVMERREPLRRALLMAALPAVCMAVAFTGQILKIKALTGYAVFTTQAGDHALTWLVPCLAQPYGCGHHNPQAHAEGKRRFSERIALVAPHERNNPAMIDLTRREIAHEMIREMPLVPTLISIMASYVKTLFHSVSYEIFWRLRMPVVHFSEIPATSVTQRISGFVGAVLGSAGMWFWALSQLAVAASRCFELFGIFTGLANRAIRWKVLFLTAIAVGLLLPTVGIGNPRYRTPAEPVLVLLLVQGLAASLLLLARLRGNTRTATLQFPPG